MSENSPECAWESWSPWTDWTRTCKEDDFGFPIKPIRERSRVCHCILDGEHREER